mmetsp:Transcript_3683/g.11591  ORF Transcript_3683/g.11591 Transcript_3683/m.11591 type:complete len:411 (+) Transcript_3683:80-1312(+)
MQPAAPAQRAPAQLAYGPPDSRQCPPPHMAYRAPMAPPQAAVQARAAWPGSGAPGALPAGAAGPPQQLRRGAPPPPRPVAAPAAVRPPHPFAEDHQPSLAKAVPLNKHMFMAMGLILLAMLCFLPIWDSVEMLRNFNYAFWGQRGLPVTVIVISCIILVTFFFSTEAFFGRWKHELHTTQSLVVMAALFITLLGLVLVLVSLPLSQRAVETHNDIVYQCANSQATRHLRVHYMNLLNLRQTPDCMQKYSIEACTGFEEEKPYTGYLRDMETHFRCSGFCYEQPAAGANSSWTTGSSLVQLPAAEAAPSRQRPQARGGHGREGHLSTDEAASRDARRRALSALQTGQTVAATFPPTLFSQANFEASCDGAAARNLINFTRDTGYQMWYMGIVLIALSMCMGLWEWSAHVSK